MGSRHYDGRVTRPAPVAALAAALIVPLLWLAATAAPAAAADSGLRVTIDELTPTRLSDDATVRMSGTVTNAGDQTWADAQAYLVIPYTPFTTRGQVQAAIESDSTYTGRRVVELDSIDELGDIDPGDTVDFSIRVPFDDLNVSGFEGVYPVGMQVLATDEDGARSTTAVARATTFMPLLDGDTPAVPGTVVWPFVLSDRKGPDGWSDAAGLAARLGPGGQLRHLLDQARAFPTDAATLIIDPALLQAADDLAEERELGDADLSAEQVEAAGAFRDDLVALAQQSTTWTTAAARPDLVAIMGSPRSATFVEAVDRTTTALLDRFEITGRRIAWPAVGDVSDDLLTAVRDGGEEPVLVDRADLPGWEPRHGSLVVHESAEGPVPLLVDSRADEDVPGGLTAATVRQRLLSEAALGSLERAGDADSRADAVVVLDPAWDPGAPQDTADLGAAAAGSLVEPTTLEGLLATERTTDTWSVRDEATTEPLSSAQIRAVEDLSETGETLATLRSDGEAAASDIARRTTELLSLAWRRDREGGVVAAEAAQRRAREGLVGLSIEGPPGVTLSSTEGSFPVTISNDGPFGVQVGVRLETSNPALRVPDVEPVEVAAGERRTVTVAVDLGEQKSSVFTAQLIAADGTPIGGTDSFNVRSSAVGLALWVMIGLAGAFVLFALARRFLFPHARDDEETSGG